MPGLPIQDPIARPPPFQPGFRLLKSTKTLRAKTHSLALGRGIFHEVASPHPLRPRRETNIAPLTGTCSSCGLSPTNSRPQWVPSAHGQEPPQTHPPDHFLPLTSISGTGFETTAPKGAGSCVPAGRAAGRWALSPAPWLAWTRPFPLWKLPTPSRCSVCHAVLSTAGLAGAPCH